MQQIAYKIRNSLYLNITDRCTLACTFCPKHNGSLQVKGYDLTLEHRPAYAEIIQAIGNPQDYDEVVFCGYGEPTLRFKLLIKVASWIKKHGGHTRVNTDGLANRVNKRNVLPEMARVIDALSVSMNAQNEEVYNRHCVPALAGSFQDMLAFLKQAPDYIQQVSASAIEGLEGVDTQACEALARSCGVHFRKRFLDKLG
ncbi:MAG: TatD family nuclease-associated radical SAM protein [gamma proteobacterium symbiont of Bathyaustriella thionipta]|nr:TatD family nuclease-associated radical SAM protein [gamma proteobacterium symbiont of Bathyaustriella thionipta]